MATQLQLAMRANARLAAALETAVDFTWTTADGKRVRVEPISDGMRTCWHISINGSFIDPCRSTPSAALDLAAREAPPADAELAEQLTWTACGHSRV